MASDYENLKNVFTFAWNIENFDMCPFKYGESLISPAFTNGLTKDAEFILRLYPKGTDKDNCMCCFLERIDKSVLDVTLVFQVVVGERHLSPDLKKSGVKCTFNDSIKSCQGQKLLSFDDTVNIYLSRGRSSVRTLTLRCFLWLPESAKLADESSVFNRLNKCDLMPSLSDDYHSAEVLPFSDATIKGLRKNFCPYISETIAKSGIPVEHRTFKWCITDYSSYMRGEKIFVRIPSQSKQGLTLFLSMKLDVDKTKDEIVSFEIHKKKQIIEQNFFAKGRITVVGNTTSYDVSEEDTHFFEREEDIWTFPSPVTKDMLTTDKHIYLPDNALTILCDFDISRNEIKSSVQEVRYSVAEYQNLILAHDDCSRNLKNDFCLLYQERALCDVSLRVQKQSFGAHKAVLFARSDVFRAMFNSNMKEKDTNVVRIRDMEPDTLKLMLKFMYTDLLESLDIEMASKLYSAAEKYQVFKLKKMCTDFIVRNITVSNFYKIILLFDLHGDGELESVVLDLMCVHKNSILPSEQWMQFMKNYPRLARCTLYKVCIRLPAM